jgi:hypothetical protein
LKDKNLAKKKEKKCYKIFFNFFLLRDQGLGGEKKKVYLGKDK